MLRSFVTWLDDYLADTGAAGVLQGALGILGFGALLGAVLGNDSIKAATIVAVSLVALGMFLLLAASRRYWRRRCAAVEDLFRCACLEVLSAGPYWRVVTWRQRMTVEGNGDTRSFIAIRVASDRDGLPFFRLKLGPGWNQPKRYRDKVIAKARVTEAAGHREVHAVERTWWREDGVLEVWAHFRRPLAFGDEVAVFVDVQWPGRCRPLTVDRLPDDFCVTVGPPMAELEYVVELPAGKTAYFDPIGFADDDERVALAVRPGADGRTEVRLTGRDLAEGQRVGMRLELK
ncbi:hypothetical protein [Kutzneria sp. NPDC052558]|uniref:hypothetical protein n=1 Tax=Kutzneria sp. NPDC052558 TaxID=3364121 RepID=UPI0037CADAA8